MLQQNSPTELLCFCDTLWHLTAATGHTLVGNQLLFCAYCHACAVLEQPGTSCLSVF